MKKRFFTLVNVAGLSLVTAAIFVSCSTDDDSTGTPDPVVVEPIVLDCSYFNDNPNAILIDNPDAPVDYIVTCVMRINDDVTIEPGVTIVFKQDAGLQIDPNGSLKAAGTASKQITFTGEDKVRGTWRGIYFDSYNTKNEISNAVIEYAGGAGIGPGDIAAVKLYPNFASKAQAKLTNNTFQHNKNFAVNLHTGKEEATISGNTFKNNEKPIRLKVEGVNVLSGNNEYIDNDVNKVHLYCYTSEFHGDKLWQKASVPYLLYNGSASSGFAVAGNLTVEAGTIIEMAAASSISVRENASLKMVGTANDYITIRGVENTSGFWGRISYNFTTNPNNILKYVKIHNAGNNPTSTKGAIYMWAKPMVTADYVEFKDVLTCAFYAAPYTSSPNVNLTTSNITYINTGGEICGD